MNDALDRFINLLIRAELISESQLADLRSQLEAADEEERTRRLADSGHLTEFQADEIRSGKIDNLIVGDYLLLDPVARGGMGQVFRARHSVMKREVAVKFTLPDESGSVDSSSVARFRREVEAASKLSHPNIVSSLDAGRRGEVCYLVMEYVRGMNLRTYVREHGTMSFRQALSCILQAAQGLEYAHKKGIIHRDVKPSNLLMTDDGQVKVLDMGLVRMNIYEDEARDTDDHLTRSGQLLGTVEYMAPEQAIDPRTADARADIYSLGCTLYFLLNGTPPFRRRGKSAMSGVIAHREDPIPALSDGRVDVPPEFEGVFQKMLAKDVRKRYQAMSDLILDLRKAEAALEVSRDDVAETVSCTMISDVQNTHASRRIGLVILGVTVLAAIGFGVAYQGGWWHAAPAGTDLGAATQPEPENQGAPPDESDPVATITTKAPVSTQGPRAEARTKSQPRVKAAPRNAIPTEPVNLLTRIQPSQKYGEGPDWIVKDDRVLVPSGLPSKLVVPTRFPPSFRVELTVTRISGTGPFMFGMREPGREFYLLIDGKRDPVGLRMTALGTNLAGKIASRVDDELQLDPGEPVSLTVLIDPQQIDLSQDGRTVLHWTGDTSQLMLGAGWGIGDATGVLLGSNEGAEFEITRLELIPMNASS